MRISDFTSKQQLIINKIALQIKPNKAGLKNFFIPVYLDKCKYLKDFELKDIEFLKQYANQVVYLGGVNLLQFSNWTKPLILHYIEIKKAVAEGKNPIYLRKPRQTMSRFNTILENLKKHTIKELEELYVIAKDEKQPRNKGKTKTNAVKQEFSNSFMYKGMKLPLCLKGKTDKEIFDYIFATRMLNKQA